MVVIAFSVAVAFPGRNIIFTVHENFFMQKTKSLAILR